MASFSQHHLRLVPSSDDEALRGFLREYRDSPNTLRSYRTAVSEFAVWLRVRGGALVGFSRTDWLDYQDQLTDVSRGLSPGSQGTRLAVVRALFGWLVAQGYLDRNPTEGRSARHRRLRGQEDPIKRTLDTEEWSAVVAEVSQPGREEERWLVAVLHFLALRLSEVCAGTHGGFRERGGGWVYELVGKGQKRATLPVHSELLRALRQRRVSLGLSPLPAVGDKTPLLSINSRTLHNRIKSLLTRASERLPDQEKARHLRSGSAHWFRHTSITRQAEAGIPLSIVSANARHSDISTTMLYSHSSLETRAREIEKLTWEAPGL